MTKAFRKTYISPRAEGSIITLSSSDTVSTAATWRESLRSVGVPYTILDVNAENVRSAKEKGEKINFGDATRREVLTHAAVDKAWVLVLAMSDPEAGRRTVALARSLNKDLHIIVRTRYTAEITELLRLGGERGHSRGI